MSHFVRGFMAIIGKLFNKLQVIQNHNLTRFSTYNLNRKTALITVSNHTAAIDGIN